MMKRIFSYWDKFWQEWVRLVLFFSILFLLERILFFCFYSEYVPKSQEDILKKEKDDKEMVKRDVDEILAGINPFKVNEDLRTVPTGNATLHNK